jgi:oligopeptide/dipeptide ABC transporter ATP-binding protein
MLLRAIPLPDPGKRLELTALEGEVPSPINPPSGCRFHTRCPHVMDKCKKEIPPMVDVGDSHMVACYLYK